MLFNSMLNIRCYFTLFQNLAKLYMEIHLKYLVNELEILNQMQVEAADDTNKEKALNAKQSTLNTYTNTNLPKIQEEISGVSFQIRVLQVPSHPFPRHRDVDVLQSLKKLLN